MIDLYYWPTPNGWKMTIMLEECGLPYRVVPVAIGRGDQFKPEFQSLNPNGRMPAMIDHEPLGGDGPLAIFESGAMLLYLAEKTGRFMPKDVKGRYRVTQWLMWQVGGLGPMLGQNGHFVLYAPEKVPYAMDRYTREAKRLYAVLDGELGRTGDCIAGDYSIADMACFPWIMTHKAQGLRLDDYPHLKRWYTSLRGREALQRGLAVGKEWRAPQMDDEAKRVLFGQAGQPAPAS